MLLDGQLQHLKKLLPSQEQLFYHEVNDDHEDETSSSQLNPPPTSMLNPLPNIWSPPPNNVFEGIILNYHVL